VDSYGLRSRPERRGAACVYENDARDFISGERRMNIVKEIKQAITYGQWLREGKITKEENKLLMKKLLEGESS
jgi:hypothetical protein